MVDGNIAQRGTATCHEIPITTVDCNAMHWKEGEGANCQQSQRSICDIYTIHIIQYMIY